MFSKGNQAISLDMILEKVSEMDILKHYMGITELPCVINSPFRQDSNPSFGFGSKDGIHISYHDFATGEKGGIIDFFKLLWKKDFSNTLSKIWSDIPSMNIQGDRTKNQYAKRVITKSESDLQVKVREWRDSDIDYWKSYGISVSTLKYAEIYPISHIIITKNARKSVFPADKLAYVYVEHKEDKVTLKTYQPMRDSSNHKWINKHDGSVVSLWTKVPQTGKVLCICSSTKDALCLWENTGIPAIAPQGEGYTFSQSAIESLKSRYKHIFIMLDNDKTGLEDGIKMANDTGFINIVLPEFEGGKDISDLYHTLQDPVKFREILIPLFKKFINN